MPGNPAAGNGGGLIAEYVRSAAIVALAALACRGGNRESGSGGRDSSRAGDSRIPKFNSRPAIVFLGTSLTPGYCLPAQSLAYPTYIQAKLDSAGRPFRVVNAGVSGESSAGAQSRIDWL